MMVIVVMMMMMIRTRTRTRMVMVVVVVMMMHNDSFRTTPSYEGKLKWFIILVVHHRGQYQNAFHFSQTQTHQESKCLWSQVDFADCFKKHFGKKHPDCPLQESQGAKNERISNRKFKPR